LRDRRRHVLHVDDELGAIDRRRVVIELAVALVEDHALARQPGFRIDPALLVDLFAALLVARAVALGLQHPAAGEERAEGRRGQGARKDHQSFRYTSAPEVRNSTDFSAMPFCANSRTSCVIFIEQKCGPHIEQKCASLAPSCGSVSSWKSFAFSGSSERLN